MLDGLRIFPVSFLKENFQENSDFVGFFGDPDITKYGWLEMFPEPGLLLLYLKVKMWHLKNFLLLRSVWN